MMRLWFTALLLGSLLSLGAGLSLRKGPKPPPPSSEQRVAFGAKIAPRKSLHFQVEKLEGSVGKLREVVTCVAPDGRAQRLVCKAETIRMEARSHEETMVYCEDMTGAQRTLVCQGSPEAVGYPKKVDWDSGHPCDDFHKCPEYDSGESHSSDWGNEYESPASPKRSAGVRTQGISFFAMLIAAAGFGVFGLC